jgi:predicted nucleic-acid-binding protein
VIAVDTNVLLRYLADADTAEHPVAARLLETILTRDAPGFVSTVVLAETLWVLTRGYRVAPETQREIVRGLLDMPQLVLEHPDEIEAALSLPHRDLVDCILHQLGKAAGCTHTATFDKRFARLDGVELVQ